MDQSILSYLKACILFLLPLSLQAQEYQPLAMEGAHWIIGVDLLQTPWLDSKYSMTVRGDTSINGTDYKKVYQEGFEFNEVTKSFSDKLVSSVLYAFIRDDIAQRKVFAILEPLPYDHTCPETEEYLLFDFSVEQGDTLNWCSIHGRRVHSDSISVADSVRFVKPFFSDLPRRTIYTTFGIAVHNDGTVVEETIPIIEGFGYAHTGPFLEGNFLIDFCIGVDADCGLLSATAENSESSIVIFPNPAEDILVLEEKTGRDNSVNKSTLQIVSLTGKVVKQQKLQADKNIIDVRNIPQGFYLLMLLKDNRVIKQGRFIKK